jgi:ADP-heptose:LPS heptosyltransferase
MEFFIHPDCIHYRGDIPCKPHKEKGVHCKDCPEYRKVTHRILIIKLGALGDVIRTTPLLEAYRKQYSDCKITWLTLSPDILPKGKVDEILFFDHKAALYLLNTRFDIAVNLDKEKEAGALLKSIEAGQKFGYVLQDGVIQPVNPLAFHKFMTGMFDDVSKENRLSYVDEIFAICGLPYRGEKYVFDNHGDKGYTWKIKTKGPLVGLNTGCGDRWTSRLWPNEKWIELIGLLVKNGYTPLLLGGKQEDENNRLLASKTGAQYLGHFPLQQFINLVDQCYYVVSQVTMGMHIAIALGKKLVLMNNIFNPYEFNLFDKGKIVSPDKPCDCFYRGTCVHGKSCMHDLPAEKVLGALKQL